MTFSHTARILVAFGSTRGGTAGIATMIGEALTERGYAVTVSPAGQVYELAGFDTVIVAGALYANRWHRAARRFVRRNQQALRELPVWLVSTGPLDDSATKRDIAPTPQVRRLLARIGARGHATFGGRLSPDATGFPARAMAKTRAGDWRDADHVRRWVRSIVDQLPSVAQPSDGPLRSSGTNARVLGTNASPGQRQPLDSVDDDTAAIGSESSYVPRRAQ